MRKKRKIRLFYVSDICATCPVFMLDENGHWIVSTVEPTIRDHVVEDGVEYVIGDDLLYRELKAGETALWDGVSRPEPKIKRDVDRLDLALPLEVAENVLTAPMYI